MGRRLAAILAADVVAYSRMMSEDEAGTLAALRTCRVDLIDPAIARHEGRIVKLMGDGVLAEFASVVEAVDCATEIQRAMAARHASAAGKQIVLRIGVHLGDVIAEDDDLFGDGVNIAARLEGIAEPGGVCISRQVYDQVHKKLSLGYRNLGPQRLKNIPEPVEAFAIKGDGFADERQEIRYCRAPDGVRLAYAISGQGSPLVKTANWLNHLKYDWESPVWRHMLHELSRDYTLIRYDSRGIGMSDWDVKEMSFDAWVSDLEAVARAAGLDRFPLLGISQGCAVAVAYTARYPHRVSHLVLYGGFAVGAYQRSPEEKRRREAFATLMRLDWGSDSPAFRQMFTMQFIPDATTEQIESFNELQHRSASPEGAARHFETAAKIDVTHLLPKISVPTLVMHARNELRVPYEFGRRMAAGIPGARFVGLEGRNHILVEGEPAAQRFLEELRLFLAQ